MVTKIKGGLTTADMLKTPEEIEKAGWSVVIPGSVYNAVSQLIDKLLVESNPSPDARTFLEVLQQELIMNGVPVKPTQRMVEPV